MNTPGLPVTGRVPSENLPTAITRREPWRQLTHRIREALAQQAFFMASSDELGVLWRGEKIDAVERRRRITFFAAQHHWKVDARADGRAARFQALYANLSCASEHLSRNHE